MKIQVFALALLAWLLLVQSVANVESETVAEEIESKATSDQTVKDSAIEPLSADTRTEPKTNLDSAESASDDLKKSAVAETPGVVNDSTSTSSAEANTTQTTRQQQPTNAEKALSQVGPFIDLLGPVLLKQTQTQILGIPTNDALSRKNVVGLYFSADWCGPCRKFTPELVSFYNKMNNRFGRKDEFEIVWISRCRDLNSFKQYFTHMNWLAMPPDDALGARGKKLSAMYKVKGIPTLVLLDEVGQVITTDARNKVPEDKNGIGFPWRNPIANLYVTIVPRSLRLMIKSQLLNLKDKLLQRLQTLLALKPAMATR